MAEDHQQELPISSSKESSTLGVVVTIQCFSYLVYWLFSSEPQPPQPPKPKNNSDNTLCKTYDNLKQHLSATHQLLSLHNKLTTYEEGIWKDVVTEHIKLLNRLGNVEISYQDKIKLLVHIVGLREWMKANSFDVSAFDNVVDIDLYWLKSDLKSDLDAWKVSKFGHC